jgi:glycosyltransferase involved in cell wall biosynthesis
VTAPRRPRIGLDVRLAGRHEGGIAEYARQLARWLPSIDESRDYLAFGQRGHPPLAASQALVWTPPHHRFERLGLFVELLPYRLDLFHSLDFVPPLGGGYCRIITVQDLAFLREGDAVPAEARRYYGRWIRTAVAEADAIIAVSRATKDALVEELGVSEERIRVTYLGRDERLKPRARDDVGDDLSRLGLDPGYLLTVASFEWRKNHGLLLDAYGQVCERFGDVPPLVLVGYRGPTLDDVRSALRRRDLEDRVHLLVDLPSNELPLVYAGAELFVFLSIDEGFGLPLLDAMACGLPSVISRRGALPELAGGAALEVVSMAPDEAADAIARLLEDSDLRRMLGERALRRSQAFSWERTARETLAVYEELLGS